MTAIAVLALAPGAHAAFPGQNGKIAATAFDSFSDGIHTLNPDGTGDTWLTPNDSTTSDPAWSPDGTKIAFDRLGTNRDVWVMNADGTNPTQLTNDPADDWNPAWSPDGTRIVFESTRDGNTELYVMNADGSDPVRITNDPATDRDPSWSPDGAKIAFSSDREHFVCDSYPYCQPRATYRIFTMNVDGSDVTRITVTRLGDSSHSAADHYHPDWSPSGDQLVYQWAEDDYSEEFYANRIITTGPGGTVLSLIYGGTYPDSGVAWSPDGQYVVSTYDYEAHVISARGYGGYGQTISYCCNRYPSWQPLNRPPDCSGVTADPNVLWPPNGTLRPVELAGASDPDGDAVSLEITGVTQDERVRGTRDAYGAAESAVRLRAKRDPRGDGRVYRIAFTASDGRGGSCSGTATVSVPRKKHKPAVDSAPPSYDSLGR